MMGRIKPMDDHHLPPAARTRLDRLEQTIAVLQAANERQFNTICTLRTALDEAADMLRELGLQNLAAELRARGREQP